MKIIDITMELSVDMNTYTSLPPIRQTFLRRIGPDNYVNVTEIEMNTHVGTHIDGQLHYIADGKIWTRCQLIDILSKRGDGAALRGNHNG